MHRLTQVKAARLLALSVPLAAVLALLALAWGLSPERASAQSEAEMVLSIDGDDVDCDSSGTCEVPLGGDFTATVEITMAPPDGYILAQTTIDYGTNVTYNQTEEITEELVWPDIGGPEITLRGSTGEGIVNHGGLTGLLPPLPVSTYEGPFVVLSFTCTDEYTLNNLRLLPYEDPVAGTNGAVFTDPDGIRQITPVVNSLVVNCGEAPTPTPGPTATAAPTALPPTGNLGEADPNSDFGAAGAPGGGGGVDGVSAALWATIAALVGAGAAGVGFFGWRHARGRQAR